MIEIVDTKLWTLDLLPSCRQPLRLEGVGPVGGLGVVVNVILPAPHGPAHAPAGGGWPARGPPPGPGCTRIWGRAAPSSSFAGFPSELCNRHSLECIDLIRQTKLNLEEKSWLTNLHSPSWVMKTWISRTVLTVTQIWGRKRSFLTLQLLIMFYCTKCISQILFYIHCQIVSEK